MPTKKKQAIEKVPPRTMASAKFKTGFEKVDLELIQIPRVRMIQKTSEEFDDGVPFLSLLNSVTKEVIAKGTKNGASAVIIPISYTKSRLYFAPRDEGGGLLCRSYNAVVGQGDPGGDCEKCPLRLWTEDPKKGQVPPKCTMFTNFFSIVRGHKSSLPLVVSFGKTSAGTGRQLYNMILAKTQQNIHPASCAFKLSTTTETKNDNTYGVYRIAPEGTSTDPEFLQALKFAELMEQATVKIHDEERGDEVEDDEVFEN